MDPKSVVIGLLAAGLIYDGVVSHRNQKLFKKKIERINTLKIELKNAQRRANYYAHRMQAAEIPMTKFDDIVADLTA